MSTVNPLSREVSAKIVFCGPGLSGKTTSLQYVHSQLAPERRGELVSLATEEDRTLFFDFLPVRIPRVHGLSVRLQLYTVPGQVFYAATRKLVLSGADGVVFVADSQRARRDANYDSLESMERDLAERGLDVTRFPLVLQHNKRDLSDILTLEELRSDLNPRRVPEFETVAHQGKGVLLALRQIVREVVAALGREAQERTTLRPYEPLSPESGIAQQLSELASLRASDAPADSEDAARSEPSIEPPPLTVQVPSVAQATSTVPEVTLIDARPTGDRVDTTRPTGGVSFAALWAPSQRDPITLIESCTSDGRYGEAVRHVANAFFHLLAAVPGGRQGGMASKVALLGLDGRDYLRLCRLASQPNETVTLRDALFALHQLVAARLKLDTI